MNFLVYDFTQRGKVFQTSKEAEAYRRDLFNQTGRIFGIVETKRKITHTYKK